MAGVGYRPQISDDQIRFCFKEALAALSLWYAPDDCNAIVTKLETNPKFSGANSIDHDETTLITASMRIMLHNTLGLFTLVYPYERYKKMVYDDIAANIANPSGILNPTSNTNPAVTINANTRAQNIQQAIQRQASDAFAAPYWATAIGFANAFPGSNVVTWNAPNPGHAWPMECVRNAFAHAQVIETVTTVMDPDTDQPLRGIYLFNKPTPLQPMNLEIIMTYKAFIKLVKACTNTFIANVKQQALEEIQPLLKLLTRLDAVA